MPFDYGSGWVNPYGASMGDLIARSHDAEAHAAEMTAAAQARAAEIRGHAIGGAIQNIANIPVQIQQQRRQDADSAQRRELLGQQINNGKAEAAARTEAAAATAQKRIVLTTGTIAKGASNADEFKSRLTDLVEMGAFPKDVGAHIVQTADSGDWSTVQKGYVDFMGQYQDAVKTREVKTRNPDGSETIRIIEDKPGGEFTSAAPPAARQPTREIVTPGLDGKPVTKIVPDTPGQEFPTVPPTPAPKAYQHVDKLLDGKPTTLLIDPAPGGNVYDLSGKPVENAAARVKPIPPASNTSGGGDGLLSPEAIDYEATIHRVTGKPVPTRLNEHDKTAILNATAAQAKTLGQSPVQAVQKQAAYAGDAKAMQKMQTMSAAAESFENKALGQADIIAELSKKVGRTGSPMLNGWLLAGKDHVLGDSDTHQLFNAVSTFSAEYAKIMEGSTGSAAGSSDSARKAADRLISASLSKGSMADTLALMKKEMALTIGGYGATIEHITERMGGAPPPASGGPTIGERRMFDGKLGEWDGKGWKPVSQ